MNEAPLLRTVPIARCSHLDSETFKRTFLGRAPVIVCGAMQNWDACRTWSHAWFAEQYGNVAMHVQTWTNGRMGGEQRTVGELVELMGQKPNGVLRCMARAPMFDSAPELRRHFALPPFVEAPRAASYLFMGPPDLVTPIHFELSDGILAQVVGRKCALLFPPELRRRLGYPPLYRKKFWFSSFDPENPDSEFSALGGACAFVGEVGAGEMLYVPSRWHHHVRALDATISVNFLWKRVAARVASAVLTRLGREYG
jgi:hypothetical protein